MTGSKRDQPHNIHRFNTDLNDLMATTRSNKKGIDMQASNENINGTTIGSAVPSINVTEPDELFSQRRDKPMDHLKSTDNFADAPGHPLHLQIGPYQNGGIVSTEHIMTASMEDLQAHMTSDQQTAPVPSRPISSKRQRQWSDVHKSQDIEEVWFPGCHGDIGGGWKREEGEHRMISHVSLAWMVHEAEKAGLKFDPVKMAHLNCSIDAIDEDGQRRPHPDAEAYYHNEFHTASTTGKIHDCLKFGDGLGLGGVLAWKVMEYLPFRRMDLRKDGSWKPIRWPLPQGETRDIPDDAQIHISAINRMKYDSKYRPGNLIIGGGGRGVKIAPEKYGIGEWNTCKNEGDKITQTFIRKQRIDMEK